MQTADQVSLTGTAQTDADAARQAALQRRGEIPEHVAIIMDGNGRWARQRKRSRVKGHHEGVRSVRDITEACAQLGVEHLTLYTFSTENWHRPETEVNALMKLLIKTVRKERRRLMENGIQLRSIGGIDLLPPACQRELREAEEATATNHRMTLNLALSYSGRWDMTQAMQQIAQRVAEGSLAPEAIDEEAVASRLTTAGIPDPDLLIRTGGEQRVSNFLLWQMAYTELYFTDLFWPDFRREALYGAVESFQDRDRRFGRVSSEHL